MDTETKLPLKTVPTGLIMACLVFGLAGVAMAQDRTQWTRAKIDSDMKESRKTGARANLHGAYLQLTDLQRADLQGANLLGADLLGADLLRPALSPWPSWFLPTRPTERMGRRGGSVYPSDLHCVFG